MHRSTLLNALLKGLPGSSQCNIHTGHRLTYYTVPAFGNGPIELHFSNGKVTQADVVIGADGIRSAVRTTMFPGNMWEGKAVEPKWTGLVVYRTLVDVNKLKEKMPTHRIFKNLFTVRSFIDSL